MATEPIVEPIVDPNAGGEPAGTPATGLTQEAVDKLVTDRLARQEKTLRKQWQDEAAAEKAKADMTDLEKAKASQAESEAKVTAATQAANKRIVMAEAKVSALAQGVKPERVAAVLRLAELADIAVGEDGEPDATVLKSAVDAVLADYPEFKSGAVAPKGGGDFNGGASGAKPLTAELIAKMTPDELKARMPEIEAWYAKQK